MYPTSAFVVRRGPSHGCRVARNAPNLTRQLSGGQGFFPGAPFWGAMAGRQHPLFAGGRGRDIFDHFDDFVSRSFDNVLPSHSWADRRARGSSEQFTWQPRFDVSEVDNTYQLRGELPGVETKDLEVQFTDANTLVISGKTDSHRTEGTAPDARPEMTTAENASKAVEAAEKDSDAASVHSDASSYVQPTVEDEADANARENGEATSTSTVAAQEQSSKQAEAEPNQPRYWVSERSVGSFQRTFTFPSRIDADAVSASLKNGILDIVVPKAKDPEARRITVQ